jgi:hypothetical protein
MKVWEKKCSAKSPWQGCKAPDKALQGLEHRIRDRKKCHEERQEVQMKG